MRYADPRRDAGQAAVRPADVLVPVVSAVALANAAVPARAAAGFTQTAPQQVRAPPQLVVAAGGAEEGDQPTQHGLDLGLAGAGAARGKYRSDSSPRGRPRRIARRR